MNAGTQRTTWIPGWVLAAVFGLAAVAARAAPDGWVLHFEDIFDRHELGQDWAVLEGDFKTVYDVPNGTGTLFAKGEALLLRRFPGDVRVELQGSSARPGDLSIVLATNERGFDGGYFMGFGSNENTLSKILRAGKKVAVSTAVMTPGKACNIVAEKSGAQVMLTVDGETVMRFDDPQPLTGPDHEMVGLYLWNLGAVDVVRVYGREDRPPITLSELPRRETAKTAAGTAAPVEAPANLIGNPSFEETMPGRWPRLPALWVPEYSAVGDRPQLVRDPAGAHRGDRFLRLNGRGPWMKIHNIGPVVRYIEGGKTYEFHAWARKSGEDPSAIEFHPGAKRFELTPRWQEFVVKWPAPEGLAKHLKGFYLKAYGPADIDDVSAGEEGKGIPVPPELTRERATLKTVAPATAWLPANGNPPYLERMWIEVSEFSGEAATGVPVGVPVAEVFGVNCDGVSPGKMAVVDGRSGRPVAFGIKEVDLRPGITGEDHLVFPASLPARSRTIYYVYLRDRKPLSEKAAGASRLPDALRDYEQASRRLRVETTKIERIGALDVAKGDDHAVTVRVTVLPGSAIAGRAISPDKKSRLAILFDQPDDDPIRTGSVALGKDPGKGIWQVVLELGGGHEARSAFVVDAGLWAGGNLDVIRSDDPPQGGRDTAHLLAARGERESFQVAVAAERALAGVALRGSELVQVGGPGRIPADCWTIERAVELFVGIAHPSPRLRPVGGKFINVGNYPDPLLPWRKHDVPSGTQRVALATIRVPRSIPGGDYTGRITATAADGAELVLPVNLRVYDFDMPDRPGFTAMISGAAGFVRVPRDREGIFGKDERFYHFWDIEAADRLAAFAAKRWMTPSLTGWFFGANAIPWTYDEKTRTATLDFRRFDANAEILLDGHGVDFVSIELSSGWRSVGSISTYPPVDEWPAGWGTRFKSSAHRIPTSFGSDKGLQMMEDYARALGRHLEEKGWLDRVSLYIFDEPKIREVHEVIQIKAQAIRRGHSKLRMWGAGYGTVWYPYFDYLSVFTGTIDSAIRRRMKETGLRYFGKYNQPIDILAVARAVPLHGWSEGWDGYYHHETTTNQDAWLNPESPAWASPYDPEYAAAGANHWHLIASTIYHWPEVELNEPLPEGQTRAWASSLRIEALRESVEDVEYFITLRELSERSSAASETRKRFESLSRALHDYLEQGRTPYVHNWYYNYRLREDRLHSIRRQVCEAIEEAGGR